MWTNTIKLIRFADACAMALFVCIYWFNSHYNAPFLYALTNNIALKHYTKHNRRFDQKFDFGRVCAIEYLYNTLNGHAESIFSGIQ